MFEPFQAWKYRATGDKIRHGKQYMSDSQQ